LCIFEKKEMAIPTLPQDGVKKPSAKESEKKVVLPRAQPRYNEDDFESEFAKYKTFKTSDKGIEYGTFTPHIKALQNEIKQNLAALDSAKKAKGVTKLSESDSEIALKASGRPDYKTHLKMIDQQKRVRDKAGYVQVDPEEETEVESTGYNPNSGGGLKMTTTVPYKESQSDLYKKPLLPKSKKSQ
jgi:hypothetical protein